MKKAFYVVHKINTDETGTDVYGISIFGIFESEFKANEVLSEYISEAVKKGMTLDETEDTDRDVLLIEGTDQYRYYITKEVAETDLD